MTTIPKRQSKKIKQNKEKTIPKKGKKINNNRVR